MAAGRRDGVGGGFKSRFLGLRRFSRSFSVDFSTTFLYAVFFWMICRLLSATRQNFQGVSNDVDEGFGL